ncbi:MAG: hypothetical protein ACRCY4_00570 [Brevinema sp.]
MAQFVLHAHMPYVLDTALEYWLHEVVLNCYLPLLEMLEQTPSAKLIIHISPTILAQCSRSDFISKYSTYCNLRLAIADLIPYNNLRDREITRINRYRDPSKMFHRFADLQKMGRIRILSGLAVHPFAPLLTEKEIQLHAKMGLSLSRHFFKDVAGIWTAECGLTTAIASTLYRSGVDYTYADPSCLSFSSNKVVCNKLKLFIRHTNATNLIWDSEIGYPGNSFYQDFHSDFSLESDKALRYLFDKNVLRAGFSLRSVGDRNSSQKPLYNPDNAKNQIIQDANHFVNNLSGNEILAFDAELFGHWWHEGIDFLQKIFNLVPLGFFQFPEEDNSAFPEVDILPSTWGTRSDSSSWINAQTAPFLENMRLPLKASIYEVRARMLSQASDWLFLITHDSFKEEAIAMITKLRTEAPPVEDAFTDFLRNENIYD